MTIQQMERLACKYGLMSIDGRRKRRDRHCFAVAQKNLIDMIRRDKGCQNISASQGCLPLC